MRGTALIIKGDGGSRTRSGSDSSGPFAGGDCADHQDEFVKTNSSRWVHQAKGAKFSWQAGYGVFSVSESSVASVIKYIAEQESHHRKRSFQQEFLAFLKKNKVPYDPRYIWD